MIGLKKSSSVQFVYFVFLSFKVANFVVSGKEGDINHDFLRTTVALSADCCRQATTMDQHSFLTLRFRSDLNMFYSADTPEEMC
jgi:hypothetical protein